jgi:hypothetical protein
MKFSKQYINVARMGEERGAYRVLVGKPEGKRPLGRPRRRWVDINKKKIVKGHSYLESSWNSGTQL